MVFNFGIKTSVAVAEEWGGVVTRAFYAGERPFMASILREFDNDALNNIFPNTTAGSSSGDRRIRFEPGVSGQNRSGYDLTGKALVLLFSPRAVDRHPHILLYYAIPAIDETARLQMALSEEIGIAAVFWAGIDTQYRCYNVGKREDLSL